MSDNPRTILLVEDKPDNQLVIKDMFEFDDLDANLVVVDTAEEALEQVSQVRPILILMDLRLPGMSGLEAVELLKADPATNGIPIWAITAHAMAEDQTKAIEAGCDQYHTKPIDATELSEHLRRFISHHGDEQAA